jgi:hypothetical protein
MPKNKTHNFNQLARELDAHILGIAQKCARIAVRGISKDAFLDRVQSVLEELNPMSSLYAAAGEAELTTEQYDTIRSAYDKLSTIALELDAILKDHAQSAGGEQKPTRAS